MNASVENGDGLRLSLPARPEFVGVARLTLSGLAARLGFDVDATEDIKLAVAEALNLLLRPAEAAAQIELSATWDEAGLDIVLGRAEAGLPADDDAQIAQMVMAEFMDDAQLANEAPQVRLRKRRAGH
ncbi:MAG: hypothetical protein HZB16_22070 [Armatimonadetes bacterium]|nr:hypothetical protein [Armatimonadota bacterium]